MTPCPPYEQDRELVCAQCSLEGPCKLFRHLSGCVNECPALTYAGTENVCLPCHGLCAEGCAGPGASDCVGQCRHARLTGTCLSTSNCPDGTILNGSKECISFQGNCASCRIKRVQSLNLTFFAVGMDCEGVVNGTKKLDECGVCGGDSSSCRQAAVYVRWGRKDCPDGARLLFEGFTAGSLRLSCTVC